MPSTASCPANPSLKPHLAPPSPARAAAYLVPLVAQLVHGDSAVGVAGANPDAIALDHLLHLILDGQDGLSLAISLWQCSLELLMCCDQTLWQGTVQSVNCVFICF